MDLYCYSETEVLKNHLGITNADSLSKIESRVTSIRLLELMKNPVVGKFDLNHLKSIHKQIFQDLYPFAGELRSVNISKGFFRFADFAHIEMASKELFSLMKTENYLKKMPVHSFSDRLAYYAAEINVLHPFREGNGRSTREFIRQLSLANGYDLQYRKFDATELKNAFIKSTYDHGDLAKLFENHFMGLLKQRMSEHGLTGRCLSDDNLRDIDMVERECGKRLLPRDFKKMYQEVGSRIEAPTPLFNALSRITQAMSLEESYKTNSLDKVKSRQNDLEGELTWQ